MVHKHAHTSLHENTEPWWGHFTDAALKLFLHFSKSKLHSCFWKELLSQWVSINCKSPYVSGPIPSLGVCVCVWWIFKEFCTLPEEVQNGCQRKEKDWLFPFIPFLSSPAAWWQQRGKKKVFECENSTHTQPHNKQWKSSFPAKVKETVYEMMGWMCHCPWRLVKRHD